MNYELFCKILNDNLVYEPSENLTPETWEEWQQDWYAEFKEVQANYPFDGNTDEEKVIAWMRHAFDECSFDTHNFQLKSTNT